MINLKSHLLNFKHIGWKTLLLSMTLILLTSTITLAAAGDLDTTFGGDGKLTTDIGGGDETAYAIAIQTDGKIVVVGDHRESGQRHRDFAVVRYKANGALDITFSADGKVTTNIGASDTARDVALQSDGKIVASGEICYGDGTICDLALARYKSNGILDTTFSGDGKVTVNFPPHDNGSVGGLAIQPDGKIVVGGYMHNGVDYDFAIYRFNTNGSLDNTFSSDGKTSTGFGWQMHDTVYDLAIWSGKIIAFGQTCDYYQDHCDFALARYNPNGTPDTSFSGDGKVTTDLGGYEHGYAVSIQSDGKIIAAGDSDGNTFGGFALARYNTSGSLDTTFSGDGKLIKRFVSGFGGYATGLAIQSDGKIVVIGVTKNAIGSTHFGLARIKINGALDTTFSSDGRLKTNFGGTSSGRAVAIQDNGKIVGVGEVNHYADYDFALARYLP